MWNINFIASALMALVVANLFITAQANAPLSPEVHLFPPPLSVGKQRSFSSGRDASMFTQQVRRRAVVNAHYGNPGYVLRETPHTSGFTNGVLELSLSGVCERVCAAVVAACNPILDAGTSSDEFCEVLDGNGDLVLDAGTSETVVC
jgi:hypothetical protein|uniref:Uncharacterized protein n=1 Tax=viral metagenome TaxID=1070528 RepID=A0A6C0ENT1_9ZZZZ